MVQIIIRVAILSFCSTAVWAADRYTIDSRHTFPSFEINHLGFSTQRGRFNQTEGKIVLDADKGRGSIDVTVDMASINTGLAELEEHLRGKDFFDVVQYPTMQFKSDKLHFAGEKLIGADGMLTLHGVTKPVSLKVDHFYCGINPIKLKYTCGANAVTKIKRADFGVDKYVPMVSDEVKVVIQVEATRD